MVPLLLIGEGKNESFLSDIEYGKMLYNNPRGIPCSKCHGEEGRGGHKIAKYYDKFSNPKILKGDSILDYSFDELKASVENRFIDKNNIRRRHRVMPKYYLTDREINAIYLYLQYVKKGDMKSKK
ncbi:MAG: cytochrome c [Epsilonproteobacteria bacterium]|nr:cytochrome c [Campylobacterota bacterium]